MPTTNSRRGPRTETSILTDEFVSFYRHHRRPGLPSPERVVGLVWSEFRRRYAGRLSPGEFLSVVYELLLGFPGKGKGLLNVFDPNKYRGPLRPEDHFINMLGTVLRGKLPQVLRRRSDGGRRGSSLFRHEPRLGLVVAGRGQCALLAVSGPGERGACAAEVREAVALLDHVRRQVIVLHYWGDLSFRKIGRVLGLDHKTARRRHDEGLDLLRTHFRDDNVQMAA